MLTVACVNVGDYLGRGDEYVRKLRAGVSRHLALPHEFVCICESDKPGWWAKIDLFEPGRFAGRVLYLDLDTIIVGDLAELVVYRGLLYLTDWGWEIPTYGSGVMVWDAGEHAEIFERYDDSIPDRFRGDQDWLTHLGGWAALPSGLNYSYRYHARVRLPKSAVTISFHGRPKPHEFADGWVADIWNA